MLLRADPRESNARVLEKEAQKAQEEEMNDNNIDAPLPLFPQYQPAHTVAGVAPSEKPLLKLLKQHMRKPKRLTHKLTRRSFKKKIV